MIDTIRPSLQAHGGDIELIAVDEDNTVKVRLQGACSGCPGAKMTLKMGVERMLKEKLPEVKEVIAVE
ncbi:MAG: NifU family protein [Planctomycetota bacterium]